MINYVIIIVNKYIFVNKCFYKQTIENKVFLEYNLFNQTFVSKKEEIMNRICKEYISDAKKFFPIMGKKERAYLRGIVSELEDCIERESITSKQELYVKYRQPYDLANDYYSRFETDEIVKKIKIAKYLKILISVLVALILIIASIRIFDLIQAHFSYDREEMVGNQQIIDNTEEENEHSIFKSDDFIEDEEIVENEEIIE